MSANKNAEQVVDHHPRNVGILAAEVYFPTQYVDQEKLEEFDGVSKGKYTIGLGQSKMSFCTDNEDIYSICKTVLNNLMDNYSIRYEEIGRLEVGTETLIDKSKSVKSFLMSLFEHSGNTDVEGVDNVNACFGGTAALFNALNWMESSYWDGRYAVVIMGDIALYAKGNARPTGGAGAVAFLIGPEAPIVFDRGLRATHITHAYDFYKPVMDSEYPLVDGQLSVVCYLNALDKCYNLYKEKFKLAARRGLLNDFNNNHNGVSNGTNSKTNGTRHEDEWTFNLNSASAFIFHSPYCKLVQKSFARLVWNDYLAIETKNDQQQNGINPNKINTDLEQYKKLTREESFLDKGLEKELVRVSEPLFKKKTAPTLLFAKEIGNMYTPSLYGCLISFLLSKTKEELLNNRVCLFSYGSGLASSMFSLTIRCTSHGNDDTQNSQTDERFSLDNIVRVLGAQKHRLEHERIEIAPALYDKYLKERELTNKKVPRESKFSVDSLYPGTWYLKSIDEKYRRVYDRVSPSTSRHFDVHLASNILKTQLEKL